MKLMTKAWSVIQMQNIRITVMISIFAISLTAGAATENSISAPMPESESTSKPFQLKPSIGLSVGSSSNVGKLQSQTSGSYGKISPALNFEVSPSDSIVLTTQFNADLKQYSSADARTLADENNAEIRNLGIWFLSENWDLGGDLGAACNQSKIPVQIDSSQTTAQQQSYLEPDGRFYVAWTQDRLSIEGGISTKSRNYSTLMADRGNTFHNDFDLYGGDLKVGYAVSEKTNVSLRGLIENRRYKEKPADFTDGAPSVSTSPLPVLEESANEVSLIAEYRLARIKFVSTPALRFNKDRVFGARDSQSLKFQQKVTIPLSEKFTLSPGFTVLQESFDHFHSDPQNDPYGSPLRKDVDLKATMPFKYSLSASTQISAEYSFAKRDSNYANSSYTEHAISTGISVSM
jgi:hypothetical protein